MGNTGERGSYIAHCATFGKISHNHCIKAITPEFKGKDIELLDFSNVKQQRRRYFLLTLMKKQRDILMKKISLSTTDKEELDRINYIISTIISNHITDDRLNDLLIYITSLIRNNPII